MVLRTISMREMVSMRIVNFLLMPNMYELKQKCDSPMYSLPKKMIAVEWQEQL